jgi:hypothetical protein
MSGKNSAGSTHADMCRNVSSNEVRERNVYACVGFEGEKSYSYDGQFRQNDGQSTRLPEPLLDS